MPTAVNSPAAMSPSESPGRTGRPPGSPVMLMTPPMPCTTMSSAGRSRSGPVCPKPDVAAYTRRGLRACSTSQPRPRRSIVPGVKFSMTTSACSTARRNRSLPSAVCRSMAMLRLPRLMLKKYALSPSTCGPVVRATSPHGGRSTFTTSAPRSHSTMLANGPESTHVRSRIVTSDSGPVMALAPDYVRAVSGHSGWYAVRRSRGSGAGRRGCRPHERSLSWGRLGEGS